MDDHAIRFMSFNITDLVDILIVSIFLYSLLVWFKKSRSVFVLFGMMVVGGFYLVGRVFRLTLTTAILQAFFAVFLIVVIVIFQEEIRQFFERIAIRSLLKGNRRKKGSVSDQEERKALSETVFDLASDKIGAILVLKGLIPIDRHLSGGVPLRGQISEEILKSIFDPGSDGHDGAVVIEDNRIVQFGCRLPLSTSRDMPRKAGLRHAAALGLSELSDSVCIVVSEERGTVRVAREGELSGPLDQRELEAHLDKFFRDIYPARSERTKNFLRKNLREMVIALALAGGLWFFFVHESGQELRDIKVPVEVNRLDSGLELVSVEPREVRVVLSGARRAFYFFDRNEVRVVLKQGFAGNGTKVRAVLPADVIIPEGIAVEGVQPGTIKITTRKVVHDRFESDGGIMHSTPGE